MIEPRAANRSNRECPEYRTLKWNAMQLNLAIAVTLMMWLSLVLAVVATAIRWIRRTHPGYRRWGIAGLFLVLSLVLLFLPASAPAWISTVSADAGIAIASILYLEGAREFRGLAPRSGLAYVGGAVTIGAVAFYCYVVPNMNARAVVMSTFLGIILALVAIRLLLAVPPAHKFGQTFTGTMFALCAATLLVRAFYCYFGPRMIGSSTLSGPYGVLFLAIVAEMAAFSIGITLMADEGVISNLKHVGERASLAHAELARYREAQAALRESEERFRRVFEEGPLGLALVGKDYHFLKINSALCQMVGYTEQELVQRTFADITHPDDIREDMALAERLFSGKIPSYRMQKRYLKKNGEVIWINLTSSVIRDHEGEPLYGLAMVEDITEVKRTQEESRTRQKLESLGTLASGIAHDFNNLLGGVLAQAELGLGELAAGANPEAELKAIRNAALRGSEIVRELMIYAGKEGAVVRLVDISQIVNEMLELLKVSLSKRAVLETDLGEYLPPIQANAARLRQIVMNLVTNASDAMDDRPGVIRVSTKRVKVAHNSSATSDRLTGDCVQLEVSDTGRGMSAETQAKVFDPFFTTKSAGHGLGLPVVEGIVRSLGGRIHLTSGVGKGTTFQILIPCADHAAIASSETISGVEESSRPSAGATVLVVEDEDSLRQAVGKMLGKAGFEVFEAADGSSAIDLLHSNGDEIDVVFLDLTIPGASSREVVAEAVRARPDIRVVLTSAYDEEMIPGALEVPQVCTFVRKPFQIVDVVKTLLNACPVR
jgi:PAS domain S-box-containing protein